MYRETKKSRQECDEMKMDEKKAHAHIKQTVSNTHSLRHTDVWKESFVQTM